MDYPYISIVGAMLSSSILRWPCDPHLFNPLISTRSPCCVDHAQRRCSQTRSCDEDITFMDTTSSIHWNWSSTYFQIVGKHLLATIVTASYGFQFESSTTPWKDHQVYFETDSVLMWIPYQSRSQSLIFYRDVFCQRWVCFYMLLLMILRIDCYLIMLWWLGTMEEIRKDLKIGVEVQRSRVAKPNWSPNTNWAEIQFGFQEQSAPKPSPRSHTNSILDNLYMDGKIRGSAFQWNQSHI
jgi:hypothetical protein